MKDRLLIVAGLVAALGLGACEARVSTNNSSVVIRTDQVPQTVENTVRSAGNAAERAGDAIENRARDVSSTLRNIDVDVDVRDRRSGDATTNRASH